MTPIGAVSVLFWILMFWRIFAPSAGLISKKEALSVAVVCDVLAVVIGVMFIASNTFVVFAAIFTPLNAWYAWLDYKRWKNSDDDDDFRHRRKSKAKSHLPKPTLGKPAYISI